MSVHGEYSRALETLIDHVRTLSHQDAVSWLQTLESARIDDQRDLSTAARTGLGLITRMQKDPVITQSKALREPIDHLEAHIRAILGPN